ncbi:MAG: 4Fe-4S dicluster domain-containing protein, partial [Rhodocyclaceae bacterium]|nr:4Fe-4S dicluster domain-containing protein [Rhodocyclaceae bacterium]
MAQGGEPVNSGRRAALKGAVRAACGAALLPLLLSIPARSKVNAEIALRPPGALPEADFLAACVRCGLCVRDCPYDTLKLAEVGDGVPLGTPFFNARAIPCEMCEDIPCVPACPTGAL